MKHRLLRSADVLNGVALLLGLILILQFAVLGYFNICLLRNHAGYDSSWAYLKAAMMWNEKSLSSPMWVDTSNAFLDSPTLPAALLYGITGNLFLSYGIANILILILVLWAMWSLLTKLNLNLCAKLAALNLLVCPYLSDGFSAINDLSYLGNMLAGASYYSVRVLLALLVFNELIRFRRENRFHPLCVVSVLLCLLAGISSGIFMLIVLLVPCLFYELLVSFLKEDWKQLIKKESLYLYACCAALLFGRFLARYVFGIIANDINRTWTTVEMLWQNTGAVIQGMLKLIGALPLINPNVRILTAEGIFVTFPLFIALLFLLGTGCAIKKIKKDLHTEDGIPLLMLSVLLVTFIIFSLFKVQYGSLIFEERYLIISFLVFVILAAVMISRLKPHKPFTVFILVGLIISIAGLDLLSDQAYIKNTNDSWQMDEIVEAADEKNAHLIYFWGEDSWTIGNTLRVYDMDRIYKGLDKNGKFYHWGDYLYLENHDDYSGPTLLIIANSQPDCVPEDVLSYYDLVRVLNNVTVYACDHNPLGLKP